MKRLFQLIFIVLICFVSIVQSQAQKKVISHDDYVKWRSLGRQNITNDGNWISYEITLTQGDGKLYLLNPDDGIKKTLDRGNGARLSPNSDFLAAKIKVQTDTLRKAKFDKVKKDKMPKDSLAIWVFNDNKITK
ncbi:S9 family peptidase, partial [Bacteroidota bacterium]